MQSELPPNPTEPGTRPGERWSPMPTTESVPAGTQLIDDELGEVHLPIVCAYVGDPEHPVRVEHVLNLGNIALDVGELNTYRKRHYLPAIETADVLRYIRTLESPVPAETKSERVIRRLFKLVGVRISSTNPTP